MASRTKILIASDKFRPRFSAQQVCKIISQQLSGKYQTRSIPLADGGEGSLQAISESLNVQKKVVHVKDPLFRTIPSSYLMQKINKTAYIEMHKASGLALLSKDERNPLKTTTYGTGQLMKHAINEGCTKIVLMIGGSATNQGGIGAASALGYHFVDRQDGSLLPIGQNLGRIDKIIPPDYDVIGDIKVEVATDVTNPLLGPNGATHFYGGQKGATKQIIQVLEKGMINLNCKIIQCLGKNVADVPGSGAAGGLGAGSLAFFNAKLTSGFDVIQQISKLEQQIKESDIIITGQGKVDKQTLNGKLVHGVVKLAEKHKKPVMIFCGKSEIQQSELGPNVKIFANQKDGMTAAFSIDHAEQLLRQEIRAQFLV